ncbi:hypothetical protein RB195_025527 [Necator americanus]|uniref:Uncharacterized protein n=1 Tax=Necator americanus TaxID=51031 RepID=A0ABR1ESQ6_NECAM
MLTVLVVKPFHLHNGRFLTRGASFVVLHQRTYVIEDIPTYITYSRHRGATETSMQSPSLNLVGEEQNENQLSKEAPSLNVISSLLRDLIMRTQDRTNKPKVEWNEVAGLFKEMVSNNDSPDRDLLVAYRDNFNVQFDDVSLKKAVFQWTGTTVCKVLSLPEFKSITSEFKLYVAVRPLIKFNNTSEQQSQRNKASSGAGGSRELSCSSETRPLLDCRNFRRSLYKESPESQNNSEVGKTSVKQSDDVSAKRMGSVPMSDEDTIDDQFDSDRLQKAADFLTALIKRTAQSEGWPLVNWLKVQRRYRDVVNKMSDHDLFEKYWKDIDLRRRHLDSQVLLKWTGMFDLEQVITIQNFCHIGIVRDGSPPADLFVMIDTPETPLSRIFDYTQTNLRMELAEKNKMCSRFHRYSSSQNDLSHVQLRMGVRSKRHSRANGYDRVGDIACHNRTAEAKRHVEPEEHHQMSPAERMRLEEYFRQRAEAQRRNRSNLRRGQARRGRGGTSGLNGQRHHDSNWWCGPTIRERTNAARGSQHPSNFSEVLRNQNINNTVSGRRISGEPPRIPSSPQCIPGRPLSSSGSLDNGAPSPKPEGVYTDDELRLEKSSKKAHYSEKTSDPMIKFGQQDIPRNRKEGISSEEQPTASISAMEPLHPPAVARRGRGNTSTINGQRNDDSNWWCGPTIRERTNAARGSQHPFNFSEVLRNQNRNNTVSGRRISGEPPRIPSSPQCIPGRPLSSSGSLDNGAPSPKPEGVYTDDELRLEKSSKKYASSNLHSSTKRSSISAEVRTDLSVASAAKAHYSEKTSDPMIKFGQQDIPRNRKEGISSEEQPTASISATEPLHPPAVDYSLSSFHPRTTQSLIDLDGSVNEVHTRIPIFKLPGNTGEHCHSTASTPRSQKSNSIRKEPLSQQNDLRFQAILSSAEWKLQERLNDGKPPSGALRIPRASKLIKGSAAPLQTVSALSQRSSPCQNGPKDPFTPLNTSSYSGLTMQPLRPGDITTNRADITTPRSTPAFRPLKEDYALIDLNEPESGYGFCTPLPQELPDPTVIFGDFTERAVEAANNIEQEVGCDGDPYILLQGKERFKDLKSEDGIRYDRHQSPLQTIDKNNSWVLLQQKQAPVVDEKDTEGTKKKCAFSKNSKAISELEELPKSCENFHKSGISPSLSVVQRQMPMHKSSEECIDFINKYLSNVLVRRVKDKVFLVWKS